GGRIEADEIVRTLRPRAGPGQDAADGADADGGPVPEPERLDVGPDGPGGGGVPLHQHRPGRPAGQRLQAEGAAPGVEVEHAGSDQAAGPEGGEDRLLHPVAGRPHPLAGRHGQAPAARLASDDAGAPPGRIPRTHSAGRKPSVESAMAWRRASASAVCGSAKRKHHDSPPPRPTRPRSWWSWESPNRSASSTTRTVALGTSTPTSMTVV